jgi:hypothetical protein
MKCLECQAPAEWIRNTQFSGKHHYCDRHARLEKDFNTTDSDYFVWVKIYEKKS